MGPTSLPMLFAEGEAECMTDGAHVHQCPYCELKFLFASEVKGHIVADHPAHGVSYVGMTTTELERVLWPAVHIPNEGLEADRPQPARDRPLNFILVGTYPPTECGLATYTANLREALQGGGAFARVIRLLDSRGSSPTVNRDVVAVWRLNDPHGLDAAIAATRDCDVVIIQHEFGIYPGKDGEDVVDFVDGCDRPIVTVLHTVLENPTPNQARIVEALATRSGQLVVHTAAARDRLLAVHDLDPELVQVIPHGAASNITGEPSIVAVEPLMLTWGLLGPGKGIEYGIEVVAILREQGLDVRYVVGGETHPNVYARDGERYREQLHELARERGVADLVVFDGVYRDWASLQAIVRSASIVLLPYDSKDQVTSGVLVEALAAGKPVVATAFPHAIELSRTGAVAVVDRGSADHCARVIRRIATDSWLRKAMENAARIEGARYDWSTVGRQYTLLAQASQQRPIPVLTR